MELRRDSGRLAWGIIMLAAGLVLLLGNFGYLGWLRWDRWWPLVLIAIGLWMLGRRPKEHPTGGIILIGLGLAFLLDDVLGGNALPALILIAVGVAVLLRGRSS